MLTSASTMATIPASDIDRALAFYRDTLGLEVVDEIEGQGYTLRAGDTKFLLYGSQFAGTNKATAMSFVVEDVDLTVKHLRTAGVDIEDYDFGEDFRTVDGIMTGADGLKAAWFVDPEGNTISVNDELG